MRAWSTITVAILAGCAGGGGSTDPDAPAAADGSVATPDDAANGTDGAGADASAAPDGSVATDPGLPGGWDVHEANASASTAQGTASLTVFSPSLDGGATPDAGPFPLVVVSTGFQIGRANYEGTARHLASWGYVVLTHDYTSGNHQEKAAEIGDLVDWALEELDGRVDAARIAVAGHSMGGKVSINAAILDDRIDAVVGWDPVDALPPLGDGSTSVTPELMAGLTVPLAVLGETTDAGGGGGMACAPATDNYAQYFEEACEAPAALEVTIAGADHTDWVDDRSACGFACFFCGTGTAPDATTHEITRRVTTAWLEVHLRGHLDYAPFLASPGVGATIRTNPGC